MGHQTLKEIGMAVHRDNPHVESADRWMGKALWLFRHGKPRRAGVAAQIAAALYARDAVLLQACAPEPDPRSSGEES